jgi:hypothetical protein
MTTLHDYLMDLAKDIEVNEGNKSGDPAEVRETEDIVDEYIEAIKERLIG